MRARQPEGATTPSTVKVLIVAVHNDELSLLDSVVKLSGLSSSFFEIEIFSTIRSVVDEPIKPVMVLDIGASATKVYVVERGVVALSHNIRQGGQDVTRTIASSHDFTMAEAEKLKKEHGFGNEKTPYDRKSVELVFDRIFDEARRALLKYEAQHGKTVAQVVLTGGGGVTKQLQAFAKEFFARDVQLADPFARTSAPAFMRPVLTEIGPEFAVAVGVALRKLEELG